MGIVHHATYLVYFEAGRVEWLRRRGITYTEWTSRGLHLPVATAEVQYKSPSRFDDELTVTTTLAKMRTVSLEFTYRITGGESVIVEGATRLACVDSTMKLLRLPADIQAALLRGETNAT